MSSSPQFEAAWNGIEASWTNGQLAHAYLLHGAPQGAALRFAVKLLGLVFNQHPQVFSRMHPDITWIEPHSKSRQISIEDVRDLIRKLSQTSFSGGWKAGVILCADRMMEPSANSFLKTLEEPSPRTLLILITAEPQSLLPTVCSRCQRIVLADSADAVAAPWENTLIELLGDLPPATVTQASGFADRLMALLEELRAGFEVEETARLPEDLSAKEAKALLEARCASRLVGARSEILRTILYWQRDVLLRVLERPAETLYFPDDLEAIDRQAMLCTRAAALQRIAAVDEMNRRFERSLPAEAVLNSFFMQFV